MAAVSIPVWRQAKVHVCTPCQRWVISGYDRDAAAVMVSVDPTPLDPVVADHLAARQNWTRYWLTDRALTAVLVTPTRPISHLPRTLQSGTLHVTHDCQVPVPKEVAVPMPAPISHTVRADGIPF